MESLRVMLVDDQPALLAAWQRFLTLRPDIEVVATLSNADELQSAVATHRPAVVLLDLSMPGTDPLEAVRGLHAQFPEVKFIAFSGYNDAETLDRVHAAGVSAFVDKLLPPQQIVEVLLRIAGR